jgi:hypothetical protein
MTLIIDNRANLQGQPGLHVLIAGVSAYRYLPKENEPLTSQSFGMRQLSSAALTAYKIYLWLIERQKDFSVPLATCRLLLSPSSDEVATESNLNGLADPSTLNNFQIAAMDWHNDAASHQGNITFFYFAGHGVSGGSSDSNVILLLEEFGDEISSPLRNAVKINDLLNGMAPSVSRPNMARTQLYFVDANRKALPSNFWLEQATSVPDIELDGPDDQRALIFYATTLGSYALAARNDQTLFSKTLLHCLNGAAGVLKEVEGQKRWCVTINSLREELLTTSLDDLPEAYHVEQNFRRVGKSGDRIIHFPHRAPDDALKALNVLWARGAISLLDGPPLVFDNRANLQDQPSLHALIVGISSYQYLPKEKEPHMPEHLGMRQLSSTALSAYKIYRWLLGHKQNFPVPLATCYLLLTPSLAELSLEWDLLDLSNPTLDNFLAAATNWRTNASSHEDNIAFFYFAGHGIQRSKDDAVLLLQDFADGIGGTLTKAVEVKNLFNGMAPSIAKPNIARTQLYFIDSCRNFPSRFKAFEWMDVTPVFDIELSGRDDRRAPIFFAAIPGSKAYGLVGEQTLFSKALIECLNGAAAKPGKANKNGQVKRHATVTSLIKKLDEYNHKLNQTEGADQVFTVGGLVKEAVILEIPPSDFIRKESSM